MSARTSSSATTRRSADVLTATTYLTRVQELAAYNEEYAKYFPANKPARTTVTVAALNAPELLVEITVTACVPD